MVMPIMVVLLPIHIRYLSLSLLRGKKALGKGVLLSGERVYMVSVENKCENQMGNGGSNDCGFGCLYMYITMGPFPFY